MRLCARRGRRPPWRSQLGWAKVPSMMLAENGADGAIPVFLREGLIHISVAHIATIVPAAFTEPECALHHQLHAVDIVGDRRIASLDHVKRPDTLCSQVHVADQLHAHQEDREDDNVICIQGSALAVIKSGWPLDFFGDLLESICVENVIRIEMKNVSALSLLDTAIPEGMSPVVVALFRANDRYGHIRARVQQRAVMISKDFVVRKCLRQNRIDAFAKYLM